MTLPPNGPTRGAKFRYFTALDCELKAWEVNALGEKTSYTYDSLKRVQSVIHSGAAQRGAYAAQSDISTNRIYDAAGRVLSTVVSGGVGAGTLLRTESKLYDTAGRLTRISGADGVVTNYSYSADTLTVTEAHPGGISIIRKSYFDGRPYSVEGNGVVNEFYFYSGDTSLSGTVPDGEYFWEKRRTSYAYANSKRWTDKLYGKFGEMYQSRAPGFTASDDTPVPDWVTTYENRYNLQVSKSVPTADGETHNETYIRDGYGPIVRTDSDPFNKSSSGSNSRYEYDGSSWYLNQYQWRKTDDTGSGSFITNSVRSRLSGFSSSSVIADVTITDPDTNVSRVTITLDRPNKTVTAVTNVPQSNVAITSVTINGLLQTLNSQTVSTPTSYYYDALGRQIAVKSPLGYWSGTLLDPATGWVTQSTNFDGAVTTYQYYGPTQANSGRVLCETGPTGKKTYHDYTLRGEPAHTWGDVPYPEERIYSDYGELVTLHTYRGGSAWTGSSWPGGTAETTTWNYDDATGLLKWKHDNSGNGPTYSYNWAHVLATSTSARGVTTTYAFDTLGNLLTKTYGDNTPSLEFGEYIDTEGYGFIPRTYYNVNGKPMAVRVGAVAGVGGDVYAFSYDFAGRLINCTCVSGPSVTSHFNPVYGRDSVRVQGNNLDLSTYYGYEAAGRLGNVSSGDGIATYTYLANSDLLQKTASSYATIPIVTTTRAWDYGFRLHGISTAVSTATLSAHTYTYDGLNRRQQDVLEDGSTWYYGYNDRNELTNGIRQWSDTSYVAGQQFAYDYDNIGNRNWATEGGDATHTQASLRKETYGANDLNEYSSRTRLTAPPDKVDIMGVSKANTVTVNGVTASPHGEYFDAVVSIGDNDTAASCLSVTSVGTTTGQTPTMLTKHLVVPPRQQIFQYDLDGNLTSDGLWNYTWDAENRLTSMYNVTTGLSTANRLKLDFSYDFMGRRSKKTVSVAASSTTWTLVNTYYYVYDIPADGEGTGGWNLLAILDSNGALLRNFVWGQDLSGKMAGAGGIGGLLWVSDMSTLGQPSTHFAAYDGNGNVTALVNAANRATTARYDYSPFGQLLRATGPMALANPFRFSTKFGDDETGLVYYGYRYYSPALGRFVSRDPAEEDGGNNLFRFVENSSINRIDTLGDKSTDPWPGDVPKWFQEVLHGLKRAGEVEVGADGNVSNEAIRAAYEEMKAAGKSRGDMLKEWGNKRRGWGGGRGGTGGYVDARLAMAGAAVTAATIAVAYFSARSALDDVRKQMSLGGSAAPGSADSDLFDLVRHGDSPWGDLDALTYTVKQGQTDAGGLVTWSALMDGVSQ